MTWALYIHILAACAWIGGSIVLFGLGIFIRDKSTQETVYGAIGPFYGYFETIWLIILIATGLLLAERYDLLAMINHTDTDLGRWITIKVFLVLGLSIATALHLYIAFTTHKKHRTVIQKFLSRGGSLAIFILNLAILWAAIHVRSLL